jgi:signal recognition particle subunit SRP68
VLYISYLVLETIRFSQQQNGLRFSDYMRYRQHCARRLRRLRKGLKFLHGKGKGFVAKEVTTANAAEVRHLMLPLYNAERAWSYAMQLREDERADKEENGDHDSNSRIKFHLSSRLKKAVKWSETLRALCAERADARTSLEAEAYAAFMAGNLALYEEDWKRAFEAFGTAHRIYSEV